MTLSPSMYYLPFTFRFGHTISNEGELVFKADSTDSLTLRQIKKVSKLNVD